MCGGEGGGLVCVHKSLGMCRRGRGGPGRGTAAVCPYCGHTAAAAGRRLQEQEKEAEKKEREGDGRGHDCAAVWGRDQVRGRMCVCVCV